MLRLSLISESYGTLAESRFAMFDTQEPSRAVACRSHRDRENDP